MKSVWFFIGLLITATIIFLSLTRTTLKVEYFTDSLPINSLATELGISPSRIRNFKEIGDINNPSQYSISFEIHPRNIMMKYDPLLSDIEKKIKDMISTNKTFDIKSSTDQDVFLSKITMNYAEPSNVAMEEKQQQQKYVKFVNPEFNGAISYLKDVQQGLPEDPFLDPRYKFEKGKLVLNEIPTPSPSLSGNNQTTRTPSSSTSISTYSSLQGISTITDEDAEEEGQGDNEGEGEGEDEGEGEGEDEVVDEGEGEDINPGANDTETIEGFNPNYISYHFFPNRY